MITSPDAVRMRDAKHENYDMQRKENKNSISLYMGESN